MNQADLAQVQRVLTYDGSIPEGYGFLVDGEIYVWNPNYHFQQLRLSSAKLESQCVEYLRSCNRVFASLNDAEKVIVAEQWLNWDKLLKPHDDNAYFPEDRPVA